MARDDADLSVEGERKLFHAKEQYLSCFNLTFIYSCCPSDMSNLFIPGDRVKRATS